MMWLIHKITHIQYVYDYDVIVINPLECFFDIKGHAALDRNLGPWYNTLLSLFFLGDL